MAQSKIKKVSATTQFEDEEQKKKALDTAKSLINELKAEIASLREELSYYRSPKFQMKLHKIEKENFDLRDKLRVYNAIIDRHNLGRLFGKNRDMGRSRDEAR